MPKVTHFYIGKRRRRIPRSVIITAVVAVLCIFSNYIMERNVYPVIIEFAESQTEYIGETIINNSVLDYIAENKISYDKLYRISKSSNGNITSVEANTYEINKLKSKLSVNIQEAINESADMYISIPILCALGNVFLSDIGPRVDISLLLSGDNETELVSEFTSVGFNQTRHDVYIEFAYKIKALIPGKKAETMADCKVPIISTIILGEVPDTMINVNKSD